jgi:hypothetical protein
MMNTRTTTIAVYAGLISVIIGGAVWLVLLKSCCVEKILSVLSNLSQDYPSIKF